jgi:hypothetical protein
MVQIVSMCPDKPQPDFLGRQVMQIYGDNLLRPVGPRLNQSGLTPPGLTSNLNAYALIPFSLILVLVISLSITGLKCPASRAPKPSSNQSPTQPSKKPPSS